MSQMPRGELLTREMSEMLPLYCYVEKRAIQTLLQQGVKVNEKTRLEIIEVHYAGEAGGIVCGIKPPEGKNMLFMSATNFRFTDEGAIYDKINEYKKARIKWLNEEERKDRRMGLGPRIKNIEIDNAGPSDDASPKVSRNAPCPCGSGKKYKHCCLK